MTLLPTLCTEKDERCLLDIRWSNGSRCALSEFRVVDPLKRSLEGSRVSLIEERGFP